MTHYLAYSGRHADAFESHCKRLAEWIVCNPTGVLQVTFLDAENARRSMQRVTEILEQWAELAPKLAPPPDEQPTENHG